MRHSYFRNNKRYRESKRRVILFIEEKIVTLILLRSAESFTQETGWRPRAQDPP